MSASFSGSVTKNALWVGGEHIRFMVFGLGANGAKDFAVCDSKMVGPCTSLTLSGMIPKIPTVANFYVESAPDIITNIGIRCGMITTVTDYNKEVLWARQSIRGTRSQELR